jgi:pectate lyase
MRLHRALFAVVGAGLFGQGCGGSSGDPGDSVAGTASGAKAGQSASGAGTGANGGSPGTAGSPPAGGASSGGTKTAGGGGLGAGGGSGAGATAGGATGTAGTAAGGSAHGGGSGAGSGGNPAGGAGGQASGGSGGGMNNDGPCPVPSYIASDPKPIGWASQGSGTTGGGTAKPILVTTLAQLKSEVSGNTAKVIYVQGDFEPSSISFGSNKTIVGCSPGARLQGHLGIGSSSSNLIFRNLKVSGYGVGDCSKDPSFDAGEGCSSGQDAISVNGSAHHVWFDHCSIMDGTDGNLDITNDADFVTVSFSKFSYTPRTDNTGSDSTGAAGHRFSNLVGGTDDPPTGWPSTRPLNVTWHHNWWADGVVERQPRVRYGRNHLFNNYYSSSASNYCVRAGIEASILLEANYFDGVHSPHQFNSSSNEKTAFIALGAGDRVNTNASTSGDKAASGGGSDFTPPYAYELEAAGSVPATVKTGAGPH